MTADDLLDWFGLAELRDFRASVDRLREVALSASGTMDVKVAAAGRISAYDKVIAVLDQRIAAAEVA